MSEQIKAALSKVDQLPQRQDGSTYQLKDLIQIANKFGLYDAADVIKTLTQPKAGDVVPNIETAISDACNLALACEFSQSLDSDHIGLFNAGVASMCDALRQTAPQPPEQVQQDGDNELELFEKWAESQNIDTTTRINERTLAVEYAELATELDWSTWQQSRAPLLARIAQLEAQQPTAPGGEAVAELLKIMDGINGYFISLNGVPVERATIPATTWKRVMEALAGVKEQS